MENRKIYLDIDKETLDNICQELGEKLTKEEAIKAYVGEHRHRILLEEEISKIKESLKAIVEIINYGQGSKE